MYLQTLLNSKYVKIVFGVIILLSFLIINVEIKTDEDKNNVLNFEVEVTSQSAYAKACWESCFSNIERVTGPNGTQRWSCDGSCGCDLIWTRVDDISQGTCSKTNPGQEG